MNLIFVVSSPTGVGKTTICSIETKKNSNVGRVVTHTTRPPRPNEIDGRDYYFTTQDNFKNMLKHGEFIEYAVVHGNYYGTSKKALMDVLKEKKDALLAIDVQGARNVMKQFDNVVSIFILPPSFEDWLERIKKDGTRGDINIRLKTALDEFSAASEFDFCIINDELNAAVSHLESIMDAQHNRMKFVKDERMGLIKELKKKTKEYLEG
jgi:guanylate kinase